MDRTRLCSDGSRPEPYSAISLYAGFGLFLLPGGRPRLLTWDIQAGGRPPRLPRPRANRSSVMIASSICSRSAWSSANIFVISMFGVYFSLESDCYQESLKGTSPPDSWRSVATAAICHRVSSFPPGSRKRTKGESAMLRFQSCPSVPATCPFSTQRASATPSKCKLKASMKLVSWLYPDSDSTTAHPALAATWRLKSAPAWCIRSPSAKSRVGWRAAPEARAKLPPSKG
jgi:hypothetical protein